MKSSYLASIGFSKFGFFFISYVILKHASTVALGSCSGATRVDSDACHVYDDDWTCNKTEDYFGAYKYDIDSASNCSTDLVGTTIQLMQEGDEKIEISPNEEAVLIIGMTGTGKSTLAYFVAGNESSMVSVKSSPGKYKIKDCNGKIGNSTTVSATIFPDLIIEEETDTAFYDNPGFEDTRTPCIEIANAYFMRRVARNITKVKFVMVTDYSSITDCRDCFNRMLKSVINFIPNIEKFGNGIAAIVTKLDSPNVDDQEYLDYIIKFITTDVLPNLPLYFQDEPDKVAKAEFILQSILNDAALAFRKIGLFRMPNACGPLDTIPLMAKNKVDLLNAIHNLNYVESTPYDFGITVSASARFKALEVANDLSKNVSQTIKKFSTYIEDYISLQLECINNANCNELISSLSALYSNPDFINNYADEESWTELSATAAIKRLVNTEYLPPNWTSPEEMMETMASYAKYLDFLADLAETEINILPWLQPMKDLKGALKNKFSTAYPVFTAEIYRTMYAVYYELGNATLTSLKLYDDVTVRQTQVELIEQNITTLQENIEHVIRTAKLENFLESNIDEILKLEIGISQESIGKVLQFIPFLRISNLAGQSTSIPESEFNHWLQPIKFTVTFIKNENLWNNFLINLFNNLSLKRFQFENSGLVLKDWWRNNGDLVISDFQAFWTAFGQVPVIISSSYDTVSKALHIDGEAKIAKLNILLNTTMNPFICSSTTTESTFEGNYISAAAIMRSNCVLVNRTKTVIVKSFNYFYVDSNLEGSDINDEFNLDILIISPNWDATGPFSINLLGKEHQQNNPISGNGNQNGKTALVGRKAGNAIAIGYKFLESKTPVVDVNGGNAQNAQPGQNGINGIKGASKAVTSSNCIAKAGGGIKISVDPHNWWCADYDGNDWCHADNQGVKYEVYGLAGTPGRDAGHGGKGAMGGFGGMSVILNTQTGSKISKNCSNGTPSADAAGGRGGTGGLTGDTFHEYIDDYGEDGGSKYCHFYNDGGWFIPSTTRQPNGNNGLPGGNPTNPLPPTAQTFKEEKFIPTVSNYKSGAGSVAATNEYLKGSLSVFADSINPYEILP